MYLLGDIGRTNTRLALSHDGKEIDLTLIKPTPTEFDQGLELVKNLSKQLLAEAKPSGVCLGISRKVWTGSPLEEKLAEFFQTKVLIENDSALVGLGEAVYGAGRGAGLLAYLTVSTGIGGVRIENGQIARSARGFEPGEQIIIVGDKQEKLENLVSGQAVSAKYGCHPKEITDEKIWLKLSHFLTIGVTNTLLHWSPEVLILGGSMFKQPGFKVETIQTLLPQYLQIFPALPELRLGVLGDTGGLYGALALVTEDERG